MPTSAEHPVPSLVDTSVAIPLALEDHDHHAPTLEALRDRTLGLAGHAYFETYSVLTRLPSPARRSPRDVALFLEHNFPATRLLDDASQITLRDDLARLGIAGGAVYDALVGAAARHHSMLLVTRDLRAVEVYRRLEVVVEILR